MEKRHYVWIRKHVNKMALVSQCHLKVYFQEATLEAMLDLYLVKLFFSLHLMLMRLFRN